MVWDQFSGWTARTLRKIATPRGALIALLAAALGSSITYFGGGIVLTHTQSYRLAEKYLRENTELESEIGVIESVHIRPIWGFIELSGDCGRARYNVTAVGFRGRADVTLDLDRERGVWTVARITHKTKPE